MYYVVREDGELFLGPLAFGSKHIAIVCQIFHFNCGKWEIMDLKAYPGPCGEGVG